MKDKLRVIIGGVILFPHIITFLCLKMNSGGASWLSSFSFGCLAELTSILLQNLVT